MSRLICMSRSYLALKNTIFYVSQSLDSLKKMGECFKSVRQRENHARSLVIFAYITANMRVISNTSDN